jgi:predicted dehydrogenase
MAQERIRLGMVGGGQDAFIGAVHRMAARIDDRYELVAGALSATPEKSRASGRALGLADDRIYDDFQEMARLEATRRDGIEAVAIVTPNSLHFAVCKAFLANGIHVICDKPMTTTLKDALALKQLVEASGCQFLLTHNYTGYPMVREARRMVAAGDLGNIRVINVEYIQDWLASENDGKQAEWRLDPDRAGPGGSIGDIGTHAVNLACFVTGLWLEELSADLHSIVDRRVLDDNAHIMMRFQGGAKGLMWVSQVAIGNENGLRLRVIGDKASLEFFQENPNRLWVTPLGGTKRCLTRGGQGFSGKVRIPAGHPEGFLEAFATLYRDFADKLQGGATDGPLPGAGDGLDGLRFIEAAVRSASDGGRWTRLDCV